MASRRSPTTRGRPVSSSPRRSATGVASAGSGGELGLGTPGQGPRASARRTGLASPIFASRARCRRRRSLLPSVNALPGQRPIDNGKPVARRGRKATGLTQVAGLPNRRWTVEVQDSSRVRLVAHAALTLGAVLATLLTAVASFHR